MKFTSASVVFLILAAVSLVAPYGILQLPLWFVFMLLQMGIPLCLKLFMLQMGHCMISLLTLR